MKFKQGAKINRPIIFKVGNNYDKQYIIKCLKYLKTYNVDQERKSTNKVFVTEHLPKELYQQKKRLIPAFKEAQHNNKSTPWTIKNGNMQAKV